VTTSSTPLRCGIIGCGQVAHQYAATLATASLVQLTACADLDADRAEAFAAQYRIPLATRAENILNRDVIDLAVVLTQPDSHVTLARQAVVAGIPVYVEKPLGLDPTETAQLLDEADRARVLVGAAPDTFLAPPAQTARAALDAGDIGTVVAAEAALLSPGPEAWHTAPEVFYQPGLGPLGDMAPYYLATLAYLLGPITHVHAAATTSRNPRTILTGARAGATFRTHAPTHTSALLTTATGVPVTVAASFDIAATSRPHLEIYGTDGTLVLPDPNFHDGPVRLRRRGQREWTELTQNEPTQPPGRGMGVLDLASAVLGHTTQQATGHLAHNVVEVIHAIGHGDPASDAK
jgi:predicted dehydrogenase